MTWTHFLNDGAAFYLPGILPAVLTALHQPLAMVGIIMAATYMGQALQPVAGILADKVGGKMFIIGGLFGCCVAGALVGLSPNVEVLLVLVSFSAFRGLAVFGTIVFIPLMWKLRGGALVSGASIISTLLTTGVIGQATGGTVSDRFGRRPVLVGSSIVMLLLLPLVVIVHGLWLWIVAAILGIAMFSTFSPTLLIGQ